MYRASGRVILKACFIIFFISNIVYSNKNSAKEEDWRTTEKLAERYPFIVALLNANKEFKCSGTIIGKRTIITSGNCITSQPHYVAVGVAVYDRNANKHNIFEIAFVKVHTDYIYELQASESNAIIMHSNIGLVFTYRSVLKFYIESPVIGNLYASELKDKTLIVVGYAKIRNSTAMALQKQIYNQMPCLNPKWYNCICGNESNSKNPEQQKIGRGAPLLIGTSVVGIAACPCVSLALKTHENKHNIFTVIQPYLQWIHTVQKNYAKSSLKGSPAQRIVMTKYVYVSIILLVLTNKVFT